MKNHNPKVPCAAGTSHKSHVIDTIQVGGAEVTALHTFQCNEGGEKSVCLQASIRKIFLFPLAFHIIISHEYNMPEL